MPSCFPEKVLVGFKHFPHYFNRAPFQSAAVNSSAVCVKEARRKKRIQPFNMTEGEVPVVVWNIKEGQRVINGAGLNTER